MLGPESAMCTCDENEVDRKKNELNDKCLAQTVSLMQLTFGLQAMKFGLVKLTSPHGDWMQEGMNEVQD